MAHRTAVEVDTTDEIATVDVTDRVAAAIPESASGTCTVFVRHTTAGVTVNEAEDALRSDVEAFLGELVQDDGWAHDKLDGNADAHLRAMLVGPSVTVPVQDGDLDLGTWQSVMLVDCDGPRTRTLTVVIE